jgi:hypothetical protein
VTLLVLAYDLTGTKAIQIAKSDPQILLNIPALPTDIFLYYERFKSGSKQDVEKLNSGSHCEERKRRGNLKMFDFIMNEIASLRSQ